MWLGLAALVGVGYFLLKKKDTSTTATVTTDMVTTTPPAALPVSTNAVVSTTVAPTSPGSVLTSLQQQVQGLIHATAQPANAARFDQIMLQMPQTEWDGLVDLYVNHGFDNMTPARQAFWTNWWTKYGFLYPM